MHLTGVQWDDSRLFIRFLSHLAFHKNTHRRLRASHGSHIKGCTCFIHEEAHTNEHCISCDGHQLSAFKGRGVNLDVEGVRYIEMQRVPLTC